MNHTALILCLLLSLAASQSVENQGAIETPHTEYNYRRATKQRTHQYFNKSLYNYMNKFEITDLERELLEEDKRLKEELDLAMIKAGRGKIKTKKKKINKQTKLHFDEKRILADKESSKPKKHTKQSQPGGPKRLKKKSDINV